MPVPSHSNRRLSEFQCIVSVEFLPYFAFPFVNLVHLLALLRIAAVQHYILLHPVPQLKLQNVSFEHRERTSIVELDDVDKEQLTLATGVVEPHERVHWAHFDALLLPRRLAAHVVRQSGRLEVSDGDSAVAWHSTPERVELHRILQHLRHAVRVVVVHLKRQSFGSLRDGL